MCRVGVNRVTRSNGYREGPLTIRRLLTLLRMALDLALLPVHPGRLMPVGPGWFVPVAPAGPPGRLRPGLLRQGPFLAGVGAVMAGWASTGSPDQTGAGRAFNHPASPRLPPHDTEPGLPPGRPGRPTPDRSRAGPPPASTGPVCSGKAPSWPMSGRLWLGGCHAGHLIKRVPGGPHNHPTSPHPPQMTLNLADSRCTRAAPPRCTRAAPPQ
jgi:hypothetical protein